MCCSICVVLLIAPTIHTHTHSHSPAYCTSGVFGYTINMSPHRSVVVSGSELELHSKLHSVIRRRKANFSIHCLRKRNLLLVYSHSHTLRFPIPPSYTPAAIAKHRFPPQTRTPPPDTIILNGGARSRAAHASVIR